MKDLTTLELRKLSDKEITETLIKGLEENAYRRPNINRISNEIIKRRKKNFDETYIPLIAEKINKIPRYLNKLDLRYEFCSIDEALELMSIKLGKTETKTDYDIITTLKFIMKQIDKNEPKLDKYNLMITDKLNKLSVNNDMSDKQIIILRNKIINHFSSKSKNINVSDQVNIEYMKNILAVYDTLISLYTMQSRTLGYDISVDIFNAGALRLDLTMKYYGSDSVVTYEAKINSVQMVNRGSDDIFKHFRYKITKAREAMDSPNKIMISDVNKILNSLVSLKKLKEKHEVAIETRYLKDK